MTTELVLPPKFDSLFLVGDDCWEWLGPIGSEGYGSLTYEGVQGAHRVFYTLLVGPIPAGFHLDHLCHNAAKCPGGRTCPHRRCVRPDHLEPVTCRENIMRSPNTVAGVHAAKTHCLRGHPLSGDNLRISIIRRKAGVRTERRCRACQRIYNGTVTTT